MDKLQWFKFSYADWRMGKIQRCSEVTQARFINLCCLYWSKDGILSLEDAEIEIDKEHLDVLISKKIIVNSNGFINISFLDEQLCTIQEHKNKQSSKGKIGNLKRWHPSIFKDYESKKITLDEAFKLSESIAPRSHPDPNPIAKDRREEKIREEEIREDKDNKEKKFNLFWNKYPNKTNKKGCQAKFIKLKDNDIDKILNTIDKFINYKPFESYNHPNPLTYLNQNRWEDEIKTNQTDKPKYILPNF